MQIANENDISCDFGPCEISIGTISSCRFSSIHNYIIARVPQHHAYNGCENNVTGAMGLRMAVLIVFIAHVRYFIVSSRIFP